MRKIKTRHTEVHLIGLIEELPWSGLLLDMD